MENSTTPLSVETLEDRMMLSTVTIFAQGSAGGEQVEVIVDGQRTSSFVASATQPTVASFTFADDVQADDVRLQFTNDLYDPANGIDRNLQITNVSIGGVSFDTASNAVFSTGTWRPEDGVSPGFGRGNILHANGYFQFG